MAAILFVLLVVSGLTMSELFRSRLRRRHGDTWKQLGSPGWIRNNSPRTTALLLRFLWRSDYRALGDTGLNSLAIALKFVQVTGTLVLVAFYFVRE